MEWLGKEIYLGPEILVGLWRYLIFHMCVDGFQKFDHL